MPPHRRWPAALLSTALSALLAGSAAFACADLRVAQSLATQDPGKAPTEPAPSGNTPETNDAGGEELRDASDEDALRPDAIADAASASGPICDGPCPVEELATDLLQVTTLSVDANNVYFAIEGGSGTVYQCPKTGCDGAPTVLGAGYATAIARAGNLAYWGDFSGGRVVGCAKDGCNQAPTAFVSNQPQAKGVVTDGVDLFWASDGSIRRCPNASCTNETTETIATETSFVASLAAEQGHVVWPDLTTRTIRVCAAGPCPAPTTLGPGTHDVSIFGGRVYWVNGASNTVVTCPLGGCGGSPVTIGSSPKPAHPISDGVHVYWRDALYDQIYRCPVAGCAPSPEILATKQRGQPSGGIAVDGEYVYWTTVKGVYRQHK